MRIGIRSTNALVSVREKPKKARMKALKRFMQCVSDTDGFATDGTDYHANNLCLCGASHEWLL